MRGADERYKPVGAHCFASWVLQAFWNVLNLSVYGSQIACMPMPQPLGCDGQNIFKTLASHLQRLAFSSLLARHLWPQTHTLSCGRRRRIARIVHSPVVAVASNLLMDFRSSAHICIQDCPQLVGVPFGELFRYFPSESRLSWQECLPLGRP